MDNKKAIDAEDYALPGKPMSVGDFKNWVNFAEQSATVSLSDAKQQWAIQKKKLRELIR